MTQFIRKPVFHLAMLFVCFGLISCGDPRLNIPTAGARYENDKEMIPTGYMIGPGDEIEILYHINPGFSATEYFIETEDTLRIEFYYYPAMSRTVTVRPDGYITLPKIGEVKAKGLRPLELVEQIKKVYRPHITQPAVTVEVIGFYKKIEDLKAAITTMQRGQARLVVVTPDGKISLPYLQDIQTAGLTAIELSRVLENQYHKFIKDMSITVAVLQAHSNRVYVLGQVGRSSFYELQRPVTLVQLISIAGGFTEVANTQQVVVISRGTDGSPQAASYNMDDIIGGNNLNADPLIKQYDVVFVPRTKIAQAALVGESIWRLIPLEFTAAYSLGGKAVD